MSILWVLDEKTRELRVRARHTRTSDVLSPSRTVPTTIQGCPGEPISLEPSGLLPIMCVVKSAFNTQFKILVVEIIHFIISVELKPVIVSRFLSKLLLSCGR